MVLTHGDAIVLRRATVVGDSVVGWRDTNRVAIAVAEVRQIEARGFDAGRTLRGALVVWGAALAVGFAVLTWALVNWQ